MIHRLWVVVTARRNVTPTPMSYTRAVEVRDNWRRAGLEPRLVPYGKRIAYYLKLERARVGARPEAVPQ